MRFLKNQNQLDATYYFIVLLIGSTCFGHYYAHHQKLATMMLITTLVVSFCKDGGGSVNVKLWFLVVCVQCEVFQIPNLLHYYLLDKTHVKIRTSNPLKFFNITFLHVSILPDHHQGVNVPIYEVIEYLYIC